MNYPWVTSFTHTHTIQKSKKILLFEVEQFIITQKQQMHMDTVEYWIHFE